MADDAKQQWPVGKLRDNLLTHLKHDSKPKCVLLDGLDEFHGNDQQQMEIVQLLHQMCGRHVRLCLASRPTPIFNTAFVNLPSLKMQDFNRKGIEQFVKLTLERSLSSLDFYEDGDLLSLSQSISGKADGVFLWAQFAINELVRGFAEGDDLLSLQTKLEKVPPELRDIYSRILQRLDPQQRREAGLLLQLVCFAKRELTIEELLAAKEHVQSNFLSQNTTVSESVCQKFERKILSVTGGILQTYWTEGNFRSRRNGSTRKRRIHLIALVHRTVLSYLELKGWGETVEAPHEGMSHPEMLWLRICVGQTASSRNMMSHEDGGENAFIPISDSKSCEWYHSDNSDDSSNSEDNETSNDNIDSDAESSKTHRDLSNRGTIPCLPTHSERNNEPGLSEILTTLQEYAALYVFDHARAVENDVELSSYPLINELRVTEYLYPLHWHLDAIMTDDRCTCQELYPRDSLQIAIAHGLGLYVSESLSRNRFADKIESSALRSRHYYREVEWEHYHDSCYGARPEETVWMSLLEYAVHYAGGSWKPSQWQFNMQRVLKAILEFYPLVDDRAMAVALHGGSPEVVRLLLSYRSPGKMSFTLSRRPSEFWKVHDPFWYCFLDIDDWKVIINLRPERLTYGALWIACRRAENSAAKYCEVLDMLLERGEDINGLCSPFGTVLHSVG